MPAKPVTRLLDAWKRLQGIPAGKWIFSRLVGWMVPYSGSVRPWIRELRPGYARVEMKDRRAIRNHLNSIHALALANLGELTSGLAMSAALGPTVRGIPTSLSIEFLKKARGTLVAESTVATPAAVKEPVDHEVTASIADLSGEVVARVTVRWRLSPM
jgi:acyl-coenzyme A thioesterase PaaI-like protein